MNKTYLFIFSIAAYSCLIWIITIHWVNVPSGRFKIPQIRHYSKYVFDFFIEFLRLYFIGAQEPLSNGFSLCVKRALLSQIMCLAVSVSPADKNLNQFHLFQVISALVMPREQSRIDNYDFTFSLSNSSVIVIFGVMNSLDCFRPYHFFQTFFTIKFLVYLFQYGVTNKFKRVHRIHTLFM